MNAGTEGCAEVLLDRAPRIADRPLTYRVPAALWGRARIGVRAVVPLGSRTASGFIVGVAPCDRDGARDAAGRERRLREILDIPDPEPLFSAAMLRLARWVADETLSTLLDAVRCLVPPEIARRPPVPARVLRRVVAVPERLPRVAGRRQRQLLDRLLAAPEGVPVGELVRGGGGAPLKRLLALGAVRVEEEPRRDGSAARTGSDAAAPGTDAAPARPLLLWGGAGDRARWIVDAVRRAVARGGQAIVTAPEVELAETLAAHLRDAIGERVALFHSELPPAEHRETWRRILGGDVDVVCGTRSALFAPLRRLRLLIVDDEQDPSYKAEAAPRYHGRRVGLHRGAVEGARVVLGSATPSVEAYAGAADGTLRRVRLTLRGRPRVTIVDMRREREQGGAGALSRPLVDAMRRHLRAGGRVALFVNRIGYARVLACQECGHLVRCPRCLVPMPYDRETGTIRCRVCGRSEAAPQVCPRCKGVALRWVGAGTKRIEEVVARVFPEFRLARVDRETAPEFDKVAREFASGRLRLIVGTQLLLRGRRLRPSLVGVVDADAPLYRPDFRAAERAFQQVRAVVALTDGAPNPEAVVQTGIPEHPVLRALRTGLDESLYEDELRVRREFGYPPYAHLARVVASGRDAAAAAALAERAAAAARARGVEVLGPSPVRPAGGTRLPARAHCLLRGDTREAVRDAALAALAVAPGSERGVGRGRVVVDMDPEEID
ncbi:MAG TPA: primosomal protein N' [bacterium]|nr:primosomal protein N' [bacterium]